MKIWDKYKESGLYIVAMHVCYSIQGDDNPVILYNTEFSAEEIKLGLPRNHNPIIFVLGRWSHDFALNTKEAEISG